MQLQLPPITTSNVANDAGGKPTKLVARQMDSALPPLANKNGVNRKKKDSKVPVKPQPQQPLPQQSNDYGPPKNGRPKLKKISTDNVNSILLPTSAVVLC